MYMSPIISQLTNKIQFQILVTMTQTKLARPTTTTSPIMTQTKLDRPTSITPYNNPQYPMYINQNYNHPPTPTNLLSHFYLASLNSNEQFLNMGWPTKEHDVPLSLGYGSQVQSTADNNDEDQHDPQVNCGRNHRRRGCGTAGHL